MLVRQTISSSDHETSLLSHPLLRRHVASYGEQTLSRHSEAAQLASPGLASLRSQLMVCGFSSVVGPRGAAGLAPPNSGSSPPHSQGGGHPQQTAAQQTADSAVRVADARVADARVEGAMRRLEEERRWPQLLLLMLLRGALLDNGAVMGTTARVELFFLLGGGLLLVLEDWNEFFCTELV